MRGPAWLAEQTANFEHTSGTGALSGLASGRVVQTRSPLLAEAASAANTLITPSSNVNGTTSVLGYLKLAAVIVGGVTGSKQRSLPRSVRSPLLDQSDGVRRFWPATRGHHAIEALTLGPRHSAPIENTRIADKKVRLAGRRDFLRLCTTGSDALVAAL